MKDYQLLMAAEASKAAYENPRQTIDGTGIFSTFGGGILHISYSGTQNSDDVLTDLSILPNLRGCHRGFYDRAQGLLLPTLNIIDTYYCRGASEIQIVLCGHSLGGSLAQILCSLLKPYNYKYVLVVTFGAPKVWIRGCAPSINHRRCFQKDDPVPKLLSIFYAHKGSQYPIGSDNLGIEIEDHYIESYIKELSK